MKKTTIGVFLTLLLSLGNSFADHAEGRWRVLTPPNGKVIKYDFETLRFKNGRYETWWKQGRGSLSQININCDERTVGSLPVEPESEVEYFWKHICRPTDKDGATERAKAFIKLIKKEPSTTPAPSNAPSPTFIKGGVSKSKGTAPLTVDGMIVPDLPDTPKKVTP